MLGKIFLVVLLDAVWGENLVGVSWQNAFWQGVKEGIQVDPGNPSNCIRSYSDIGDQFGVVLETFDTVNVHTVFDLIKNLNGFFTTFVSSYDNCNYSSIAKRYFVDRETLILNFLINSTKNITLFLEAIRYLLMAIQYQDAYGIGLYLAKTIRFGLGISL